MDLMLIVNMILNCIVASFFQHYFTVLILNLGFFLCNYLFFCLISRFSCQVHKMNCVKSVIKIKQCHITKNNSLEI